MSNGPDRTGPDRPDDGLARSVARLTAAADVCEADREALHGHVRELAGMVTDLARSDGSGPVRGGPPILSWLDLGGWPPDGPGPVTVLADLADWLRRVYLRYSGTVLPDCWMWHPGVVEELLVLRRLWADMHDRRTGSSRQVADWHQIYRPGVAKRIKESPAGSCDLLRHANGGDLSDSNGDPAPLADHSALIARSWARDGRVPHPTPEMLAEVELQLTRRQGRTDHWEARE